PRTVPSAYGANHLRGFLDPCANRFDQWLTRRDCIARAFAVAAPDVVVHVRRVTAPELSHMGILLSSGNNATWGPLILLIWRRRRGANPSTRASRDAARLSKCQIRGNTMKTITMLVATAALV